MESLRRTKADDAFEAVKQLRDSGVSPAAIFNTQVWGKLMSAIDKSIEDRKNTVTGIKSRFSKRKRDGSGEESAPKRAKTETTEETLSRRKLEALGAATALQAEVGTEGAADSYEAYRKQCWVQYYQWLATQKPADSAEATIGSATPAEDLPLKSTIEDDEIAKQLLG